jgi:antitoxin (DNA-binding transcriptional repressor) of toxin-antitoxin stability system
MSVRAERRIEILFESFGMTNMTLDDVQHHLPDLIAALDPGDQLVITKDGEPIATLTRNPLRQWPCKAGSAKDTEHWMAPDFDAPLEDFREYME